MTCKRCPAKKECIHHQTGDPNVTGCNANLPQSPDSDRRGIRDTPGRFLLQRVHTEGQANQPGNGKRFNT